MQAGQAVTRCDRCVGGGGVACRLALNNAPWDQRWELDEWLAMTRPKVSLLRREETSMQPTAPHRAAPRCAAPGAQGPSPGLRPV